jgi:benzoyl-CoA reductase/2-hydroxyglutaryl-CoA dehydratase subunit BcrC/BadD/HgdB
VAYTCAYTPLALIHAAGLVPHRLIPTEAQEAPDQAGAHLHDNLCPHVKRVLDRALAGALPENMAGVVLMGSCDTMRRLADAWRAGRPDDRVFLADLPSTTGPGAVSFFADELGRLARTLAEWSGQEATGERLAASVDLYRRLGAEVERRRRQAARGKAPTQARGAKPMVFRELQEPWLPAPNQKELRGGWPALQRLLNRAVTEAPEPLLDELQREGEGGKPGTSNNGIPVYLFGNVMSDPEAFAMLEECGARVVGDDLCTGSRQLTALDAPPDGAVDFSWLARTTLARPPCARTLLEEEPGGLAGRLLARVEAAGARGVITHVLKFCDPYLARLPALRDALREAGVPLLVLEGDCTLRSMGQHQTRIEAFVEMLG